MSDDWNFYRLRVDDEPASIFLDMGIASSAPLEGYHHRAYIRVRMLNPRADGMSSQEEFDALISLEDAVTLRIAAESSSVYVGRNTSGGNRDLYFYTTDGPAFEILANSAMAAFPIYSFESGWDVDPDWRVYFEFLYPSPKSEQQMANRSVVENLAKHGDRADQPRQIDHLAIFTDVAKCAAFSRYVIQEGYVIGEESPRMDQGELRLEFFKAGTPAGIDDITMPLFEAALKHGGEYDGWGCIVVT